MILPQVVDSVAVPVEVPQLSEKSVPRTIVFANVVASHWLPNPVPNEGIEAYLLLQTIGARWPGCFLL